MQQLQLPQPGVLPPTSLTLSHQYGAPEALDVAAAPGVKLCGGPELGTQRKGTIVETSTGDGVGDGVIVVIGKRCRFGNGQLSAKLPKFQHGSVRCGGLGHGETLGGDEILENYLQTTPRRTGV